MKEFDSSGLRELHRVLELSQGPPQIVDFQDELVQQAIGLNPFLRRGLAPGVQGGVFTASILNTHTGSDTVTTTIDPRAPGTTFVGNAYPDPVPDELDIWLLTTHAEGITGTGDFGGGFCGLITDALGMGWRNEANAIAVIQMVQFYSVELVAGNRFILTGGGSDDFPLVRPQRRIGHRTQVRFETVKTGVGAATFKCFLTFGLFPAGLGQDGV